MNSPFDVGRDSNAAASNAFDETDTVSDSHLGAFQSAFQPVTDQLSEQDYRASEHGGSGAGFEDVTPHTQSPEKPGEFGYPTPRPGGFVNLP